MPNGVFTNHIGRFIAWMKLNENSVQCPFLFEVYAKLYSFIL